MIRLLVLAFASFSLALEFAHAVPIRLSLEPPESMKTPSLLFKIKDTVWKANNGKSTRVYIFEPDGTLSYRLSAKSTVRKNYGTWRLEGKTLYFATTTKTLEFRGEIRNDNTIPGELKSRTGTRTPLILERSILDFAR